jgi:hypothetical protein
VTTLHEAISKSLFREYQQPLTPTKSLPRPKAEVGSHVFLAKLTDGSSCNGFPLRRSPLRENPRQLSR